MSPSVLDFDLYLLASEEQSSRPSLSKITPLIIEKPSHAIEAWSAPLLTRSDTSSEASKPEESAVSSEALHTLVSTLDHFFKELNDPRRPSLNTAHRFDEILVIAICAVICGADGYTEMAAFGKSKKDWFKTFLELPGDIPSHDTFNDVFRMLDSETFERCFIAWTASLAKRIPGVVPVDGKTVRRSRDKSDGQKAIHVVSAWSSANSLVLGQIKTNKKSNEITAIPALLKMVDISNCLVTIDAMGCQRSIATVIRESGADYLLAIKDNQPNLLAAVQKIFADKPQHDYSENDYAETHNKNHGRVEARRCWIAAATIEQIPMRDNWKDLSWVVKVESERSVKGKTSIEHRYYISSATRSADQILEATRVHWQVENQLHWILDVSFREDDCRIRKGNGAENFSILRRMALNLIKKEKTRKMGVKGKRLAAGWDEKYLAQILSGLEDYAS